MKDRETINQVAKEVEGIMLKYKFAPTDSTVRHIVDKTYEFESYEDREETVAIVVGNLNK